MLSRRRVLALSAALPLSGTASIQAAEPAPVESAPLSESDFLGRALGLLPGPAERGLGREVVSAGRGPVADGGRSQCRTPGRSSRRTPITWARAGIGGRSTLPPIGPMRGSHRVRSRVPQRHRLGERRGSGPAHRQGLHRIHGRYFAADPPWKPQHGVVRADNTFSESMLPRGRSSDWAHDGGIYRPVHLLVTPKAFIETVAVDADPEIGANEASLQVTAGIRNANSAAWQGQVTFRVFDEESGERVPLESPATPVQLGAGQGSTLKLPAVKMSAPKLWHFDHPHLYRLRVDLSNGHSYETTFGVRKIEIRGTAFYLNGERVRLMGVERMAGSNPEFGMAEPAAWIDHDHADMKELNCVYTRVHWPQDRRIAGLVRPPRHTDSDRSAHLGRRYVQGDEPGSLGGDHEQRAGATARDDRARPEPSVHLFLGRVQRSERAESAGLRICQAHVRRGQAAGSPPAGDLRIELASKRRRRKMSRD